ncbi:NAD-dependent DNA ligase LigA [Bacillus sp. Marseille-P3800]|uniref:NAD-dependent DNA ligase LigA n=1 Tax=Bacillus sp. Marseille-P3800 TaxID=2014782 RepID=UPI000C08896F|nr:NAD-dependent DNA ligase LigA [Bacillus sp. Marseille-P3800]
MNKSEIIKLLKRANHSYYNLNEPIMDDAQYDSLYEQLKKFERASGSSALSPTQTVGAEVVSKLEKVTHSSPLLSLDKVKDIELLKKFIGNYDCILSLKLDGLTTKIEVNNRSIKRASTRGNGTTGENITHNVKTFNNIVLKLDDQAVVVGESVLTNSQFECINESLSEDDRYSNSRNLVSGTVRQLDSSVCRDRKVNYYAFNIQKSEIDFTDKSDELKYIEKLGFEVSPWLLVNKMNVEEAIDLLKQTAEQKGLPIDGLVCTYNNNSYSHSLGATSKFPRHSLAFKFEDNSHVTTLLGVETNTTRTGMVSLTANFKPVSIDGVSVSKASLHNVDLFESLELGVGDKISVYRANMVIPQVLENLTRSNTLPLPNNCPSCRSDLIVKVAKEARFLYCPNEACTSRLLSKIEHYVSRDATNIQGLSLSTLRKFHQQGVISSALDLYSLKNHKNIILKMEGFGIKSYNKLMSSIEESRNLDLAQFIYALGISNVGKNTAKTLAEFYSFETLPMANKKEILSMKDLGAVVAQSIVDWFENSNNLQLYNELTKVLNFKLKEPATESLKVFDIQFAVTGSVLTFKNRKELQKEIEKHGGKVSGSVSKNTNYLINNDKESNSSKNKKAKELGVRIINEDELSIILK